MGFESALARIAEIQSRVVPQRTPTAPQAAAPAQRAASASSAQFAPALNRALPQSGGAGGVGDRIVQLARAELERGVREQPPGSNNSPDIARYRTATRGAIPGAPWCAYFTSYLGREAGAPIGPGGAGMGSVDAIASWARSNGRWVSTAQGPRPGDLIVFDEHIGVVDHVRSDGTIITIEGNHSNRVDRVERRPSEGVLGYVRLR